MRTYTHGIIGYLLYLKASAQEKKLAVIGAVLPDVFLAVGYLFHFLGESLLVETFHTLFHHSFLHVITESMHSFVFVLPPVILAYFFYKKALPFFIGMLSHVIIDLITHQRSAYNHFFPFPLEPLGGIVSYTGVWFTVVEHIFVLGFILWILRKRYATTLK